MPSSGDTIAELVASMGRVERRFGDRTDSRTTIVGLVTDEGRVVVKHAVDAEAVGWLESAIRFHAAVSHPAIAPVLHHVRARDGLALVERWVPGDVLVDKYDPAVRGRDDPASTYQRFLCLPAPEIASAVDALLGAHVAVAAAGFVAVDLYDGCLLYDFEQRRLSLLDLDMYRPGPFTLEADRQYGSSAFMAPEEWQRGATIDERTTVFTLGRFALVLLGCARDAPADRQAFRGSDAQYEAATRACAPRPADRFGSVAELRARWREALPAS